VKLDGNRIHESKLLFRSWEICPILPTKTAPFVNDFRDFIMFRLDLFDSNPLSDLWRYEDEACLTTKEQRGDEKNESSLIFSGNEIDKEDEEHERRKRVCRDRMNNPPTSLPRYISCKARGLSKSHNTAFIEIPRDVQHGRELYCSHVECTYSGRKFRYCAGKIDML
jgi:hypothetical protein